MKKLFFVLLVLLAGAAVIFAVPAAHPPGGFATEAVFTGNAVTVNPVVVVLEKAPAMELSNTELAMPDNYIVPAGLPTGLMRYGLNGHIPIIAVTMAPDYHLLC